MARAAAGLAADLRPPARRACTARGCVLLVGTGDNGGDALYAGARLAGRGARVDALLVGDRAHAGGLAALRPPAAARPGRTDRAGHVAVAELVRRAPTWCVDGVLGIGGRGGAARAGRRAGRRGRPTAPAGGGRRPAQRRRRRHRRGRRARRFGPTSP